MSATPINTISTQHAAILRRLEQAPATCAELEATCDVLPEVRALFPRRVRVVAVGRVAERALRKLGIEAPAVRHPAQGGAKKFREQVVALL